MRTNRILPVCIALVLSATVARAEQAPPDERTPVTTAQTPTQPAGNSQNASTSDAAKSEAQPSSSGQQTKRILGIVPNFRSVSADAHLPPLSFKGKFILATQDSFDYSSFVYVGILAGISMGENSQPSFGHGAEAYGNYYAHSFADNTIENYMVEAFVPGLTREDPRYYTLGHGGLFKRTGYAISHLLVTRKDSGGATINLSEIVGAGAAAGISNAYYPSQTKPFVRTYQLWISELAQDGLSNIAKEFWPDINRAVFRSKN